MRLDDLKIGAVYEVSSLQRFRVEAVDIDSDTVTVTALNRPAGQGSARRARVGETRTVRGRQWVRSVYKEIV